MNDRTMPVDANAADVIIERDELGMDCASATWEHGSRNNFEDGWLSLPHNCK
jgi:hypothetical protein